MPQKSSQFENAKAVSALRSGKILEDPYQNHNVSPSLGSDVYNHNLPSSSQAQGNVEETKNEAVDVKLGGGAKEKKKLDEDPIAYQPKVPFPSALKSKSNRQ